VQVRHEPVERPTRERQVEALRVGQRERNDLTDLLGRVRRRSPGPWPISQTIDTIGVEALEPEPHRVTVEAQLTRDGRHAPALVRQPDDLGPLDGASRRRAGVGQVSDSIELVWGKRAEPKCDGKNLLSVMRL
jgi:hypothetical protein